MRLLHDYETRSEISLPKAGVWRYAADPTTEIMCVSYVWKEKDEWSPVCLYVRVWGDDEVLLKQLLINAGIVLTDRAHFVQCMNNATTRIAHNVEFERAITVCKMPEVNIPLDGWSCTMARSFRHSLPGSLDGLMKAIGGPPKDAEGHRQMLLVCQPRSAWKKDKSKSKWFQDAERLAKVYKYAVNDANSEMFAEDNVPELEPIEKERWMQILRENTEGLNVDMMLLDNSQRVADWYIETVRDAVGTFTQNAITNLGSRQQVLSYLKTHGLDLPDLKAETVEDALKRFIPETARFVLDAKAKISKASVAKIKTFYASLLADERVRDFQCYHGAHTGRTTGRRIQPLNFPRPGDVDLDPAREALMRVDVPAMTQQITNEARNRVLSTKAGVQSIREARTEVTAAEVVSACLRTLIVPPPREKFILADYSGVEMVATMTVAGQMDAVELIRNKKDMYCELAEEIYQYPVNKKDNPEERQLGKQGVLGCFGECTMVLTKRLDRIAWTAIHTITPLHQVWDGGAWVTHGGLLEQGKKYCVDMAGTHVTPDHLIAMPGEWTRALNLMMNQPTLLDATMFAKDLMPKGAFPATYNITKGSALVDTYDIYMAGPNNRYMIRTNVGPLLVHNCGFGLRNPDTFIDTCRKYGMIISTEMSSTVIDVYATRFAKVPELWDGLNDASLKAMRHPGEAYQYANIQFEFDGKYWLTMMVPSGSKMYYPGAHMAKNRWNKKGIHYYTFTHGHWSRTSTYGGKLTENAIQKMSRCMLEEHKAELLRRGLNVAFTIYDEIVFRVPDANVDWALANINEVMNQPPAWLPHMPVNVDPLVADYFTKD